MLGQDASGGFHFRAELGPDVFLDFGCITAATDAPRFGHEKRDLCNGCGLTMP